MPDSLPTLPARRPDSHKGDYGRALLIGGSEGMAGAIALAGLAALRSGTGLVKLAVPTEVKEIVAGFEPSYMTIGLPCDAAGGVNLQALYVLSHYLTETTCLAIGPGLGRSAATTQFVTHLYCDVPVPMVVDADGLNALAVQPDSLGKAAGPRVLTPHPGEFARLLGQTKVAIDERESAAQELAQRTGAIVLVKGHRTLITDGQELYFNETGNPGMATGGSGDVLTGVITALICQGLSPLAAARLGAYVHGLAGDLAAAELGQVSLIASDLVRFLPAAFCEMA